jgi:hypothetical protein
LTQTFSQGPTWITYLSSIYNTSSIRLFNLAISGATVDNDIVRQTALPFGGMSRFSSLFQREPSRPSLSLSTVVDLALVNRPPALLIET